MKTKTALLFLALSAMFFSCKKGEDDPSFSFSSRSARLAGDWVLKGAKVEGNYENPGENAANFVFTSDGNTFTFDISDSSETVTGPHQLLIHFGKNGEMNVRETFFSEGYNLEGTWDFLYKSDDSKNKERIMLVPREVVNGNSSDFHPLFFPSMERVYFLRELRKDKLVMVYEGKPYMQKGGETLNLKAEFFFGR